MKPDVLVGFAPPSNGIYIMEFGDCSPTSRAQTFGKGTCSISHRPSTNQNDTIGVTMRDQIGSIRAGTRPERESSVSQAPKFLEHVSA